MVHISSKQQYQHLYHYVYQRWGIG